MGPDCPDPRACFLGEAGGGEEESKESVFTPRCSHLAGGCPVTGGWRERVKKKKGEKPRCVLAAWQKRLRLLVFSQVGRQQPSLLKIYLISVSLP